jgi:uncharacterized protein (DUF58 family)
VSEALWYTLGAESYAIAGVLLALYFIMALLMLCAGALRWDWWPKWRKEAREIPEPINDKKLGDSDL